MYDRDTHMSVPVSPPAVASPGERIRLTSFARCAGCAAKLGAGDLSAALRALPLHSDPRLLVGRETFDDAGVFVLADDHARSDVYPMGGEPLTALNIVGFPAGKLPLEVLTEVLRGGQDKVHEY